MIQVPNNSIMIEGPAEKLAFFVSKLKEPHEDPTVGLFGKFYPRPSDTTKQLEEAKDCYLLNLPGLGERESPKESEAWYYWNVHCWGTKWDVPDKELGVDHTDRRVTLYFDTAWSPPLAWLEKVAETYPSLDFEIEYSESGCDFSGIAKYSGGEVVSHEEGDFREFGVWEEYEDE